jgi:Domain of unknown function (DUF4136)
VMQHATLFDRRLRSAVDDQLAANGFRKADADGEPDLLLVYQAGVQERVDVQRWGYAGRQWDARQYHEGGLVIDLVDAKDMSLVWRGTATAEVSSPDRSGDRIAEVVKKMFADFPAGRPMPGAACAGRRPAGLTRRSDRGGEGDERRSRVVARD